MAETLSRARLLDRDDPLASFRGRFRIPPGQTYLVGHSLGLLSDRAEEAGAEALTQWRTTAVESWWDPQPGSSVGPWLELESRTAPLLAPFFGADPIDVTVGASLGVNLQLLLHSLYRPVGRKKRIAMMRSMFPQDRWLVQSHLRLPGHDPEAVRWLEPRPEERLMRAGDIEAVLEREGDSIAVLLLESVSYVSGQYFDLERIAAAARAANVIFIVDVAHGAFVCPLEFNRWGVDAAIGCSYKFGCSGPGGVGLLYLNRRHWERSDIWRPGGWWGNDRATMFLMGPAWEPARGAAAWQVSTIPVLALAPFLGALELFREAGVAAMRRKGLALTGFMIDGLERLPGHGERFKVLTPREGAARGAEVSIEFRDKAEARSLKEQLRAAGTLIDYRESPFAPWGPTSPGILRAGVHPLFNNHEDVACLLAGIARLLPEHG